MEPNQSKPPVEPGPEGSITIRRDALPNVHTLDDVPHVHKLEQGEDIAVHTLPGDTPRELVDTALAYLAIGLALHERAGYDWDHRWTLPPRMERRGLDRGAQQ